MYAYCGMSIEYIFKTLTFLWVDLHGIYMTFDLCRCVIHAQVT